MLQRLGVVLCAASLAIACGQTDAGITTAVKSKFAADDTVKAYQIDVTTNDKVVTLEGKVETSAAKEQALTLARNTEGVRDVVDKLMVSEAAATAGVEDRGVDVDEKARTEGREARDKAGQAADKAGAAIGDAAITSAVKAKLLADQTVGGLKIDVDTSGGIVTLTGNVASRAEAMQAVKLARGTEGVERVVDNLKVGK
jgi:osmotically-inducible protein OsmY